nr:MAG TPA: SGNH hydrolase [Caudoviricetes sp.]
MIDGSYTITPNSSPLELLQDLLKQGFNVTVWNQGASGSTIDDLINGTDGRHTMGLQQLMQLSAAKFVIENFGIDDAETETLDQYMSGIDYFVTQARLNGKTPILEEPNPVCDAKRKNIPQLDAQVAALDAYAARYNVTLVSQYDYIKSLPNWQSMLVDCIHPDESLYKIKGDRVASVVLPLVQCAKNGTCP